MKLLLMYLMILINSSLLWAHPCPVEKLKVGDRVFINTMDVNEVPTGWVEGTLTAYLKLNKGKYFCEIKYLQEYRNAPAEYLYIQGVCELGRNIVKANTSTKKRK